MALVLLLALLLRILGIASRPLWYDEAFSVLFAEKGIKAMLAGTLAVQTGGAGIGYSQHAGQVIVADGTSEAAVRLERVLTTDPGMGVVRHADAGYQEAIQAARRHGIKMPMLK